MKMKIYSGLHESVWNFLSSNCVCVCVCVCVRVYLDDIQKTDLTQKSNMTTFTF
jgi:hypothetical protein